MFLGLLVIMFHQLKSLKTHSHIKSNVPHKLVFSFSALFEWIKMQKLSKYSVCPTTCPFPHARLALLQDKFGLAQWHKYSVFCAFESIIIVFPFLPFFLFRKDPLDTLSLNFNFWSRAANCLWSWPVHGVYREYHSTALFQNFELS